MKHILTLAIVLAAVQANANVWLKNEPANKLSKAAIVDAAKAGKDIYKCRQTEFGSNLKPKSVKGTKDTYHADIGESEDDATTAMLNGAKVFKCSEVSFNLESGSFKKN